MFNSLFKLATNTLKIADAVVSVPLELANGVVETVADAATEIKEDIEDALK